MVVMEHCFNGNLRDYIRRYEDRGRARDSVSTSVPLLWHGRYRDYYLDEVEAATGELRAEAGPGSLASPAHGDTGHMSDFLSSMHAEVDSKEVSFIRGHHGHL